MKNNIFNLIEEMNFPYLRISLTKDCNFRCSFCHNEGLKHGKRMKRAKIQSSSLDEDTWNKIAIYFKNTFNRIIFTGGEPTLIKELPSLIKIFKKHNYIVGLTSNGFLLDDRMQYDLYCSGLDSLNISFHHTIREKYEKIIGVTDSHEVVLNNLKTMSNFFNPLKLNFVAYEQEDILQQLMPFSKISADNNFVISFLLAIQDVENDALKLKVINYLTNILGEPDQELNKEKFRERHIYKYSNGSIWEFDSFGNAKYKANAFNNKYCKSCCVKDNCIEGPYSLRMTPDGTLKPCLIREDNVIKLNDYISNN